METESSSNQDLKPFGKARSTIKGEPLSADDITKFNDLFKASLYLSLGMIYLQENPLLREPLTIDHIKRRQLGHFGSVPGQIFVYMHMSRLIKQYDLNTIYISGPGHGAPAILSQGKLSSDQTKLAVEFSDTRH